MAECFECGQPAEFDHHVVPASRGGTKTVPLCAECHGKAHNLDCNMDHSVLTQQGLARAKSRGTKLGSARPDHWNGMTKDGTATRAERRAHGLEKAQKNSKEIVEEAMSQQYEPIVPWIRDMREAGQTLQEIVDNLNAKGCRTRYEKPWNVPTLRRVILKYLGPDYLGQKTSILNPCKVLCG